VSIGPSIGPMARNNRSRRPQGGAIGLSIIVPSFGFALEHRQDLLFAISFSRRDSLAIVADYRGCS